MAVSDGQRVNAQVTNAAFVSRTQDSDTVGIVGLNHPGSGGLIANTQQFQNDLQTQVTSNDVDITDLQTNKENKSEKGVANGYAELDGTGRIPVDQLPLDTMVYRGVWDANTNTPTLADGVGTTGDYYRTSVAGTQDLGSGSIDFAVGDSVIYNGSIWEKQDFAGASNALTTKGDLLTRDATDIVRLGVGTDGQVLVADSAEATGLKWEDQSAASGAYREEVANYTLVEADSVVAFTTGATNRTATLPAVASVATGKVFTIKKLDSASGRVTIDPNAAETIDGQAEYELRQENDSVTFVNTGTEWEITNLNLNEYAEVIIDSRPQTSVGGTFVDATEILTLRPGTYSLGHHAFLRMNNNSGIISGPYGACRLFDDTAAAQVPDTFSGIYLRFEVAQETATMISNSTEYTVTVETDIKIQIVCSNPVADTTVILEDSDFFGTPAGDDSSSKIWARRIR